MALGPEEDIVVTGSVDGDIKVVILPSHQDIFILVNKTALLHNQIFQGLSNKLFNAVFDQILRKWVCIFFIFTIQKPDI
jgi:hypothetical protein